MNAEGIQEVITRSGCLVNELVQAIEERRLGLKEAEQRIVEFVNQLGSLLVQEVVEGVAEPVMENRLWVAGEEALFEQRRPLRFRNRFGGETVRQRRCYRWRGRPGGYYPLDEAFGLDRCVGRFLFCQAHR